MVASKKKQKIASKRSLVRFSFYTKPSKIINLVFEGINGFLRLHIVQIYFGKQLIVCNVMLMMQL